MKNKNPFKTLVISITIMMSLTIIAASFQVCADDKAKPAKPVIQVYEQGISDLVKVYVYYEGSPIYEDVEYELYHQCSLNDKYRKIADSDGEVSTTRLFKYQFRNIEHVHHGDFLKVKAIKGDLHTWSNRVEYMEVANANCKSILRILPTFSSMFSLLQHLIVGI